MKQKLGLACALVRPQSLVLLDEPTVGVDPLSRRELWNIIYRLVEDKNTTVMLSTAYLDEAERCAEVILLHEGRVMGQGAPDQFSDRMAGRTYTMPVPENVGKRTLQTRLAATKGVVDAIIHRGRVRLVLAAGTEPGSVTIASDPVPETATPRFEDYFVDSLGGVSPSSRRHANGPHAPVGNDATVIEAKHAQRRFGKFLAVRDVSFEVCRGEVFGLLGANGAGKSTTFRMLCGLLPASGGRLRVAGVDLRRARATARQRIGYMSQKFSLYGSLRVVQNLEFFAAAYGLDSHERRDRIEWALDTFELTRLRNAASGALPLGYKQRLALACALMHEPDILFLDEPTSGVDPLARREFWSRINALAEAGITVLLTTHFLEEAEYCDRVAIMDAGEILSLGTPAAIKADTRAAERPDPSMEEAFIALIERQAVPEETA
jgi:ABC-2 type transport system ATP-binding protein